MPPAGPRGFRLATFFALSSPRWRKHFEKAAEFTLPHISAILGIQHPLMPETTMLSVIAAELAKAVVSEAVKESVKDWLKDTVRVRRAIRKTASAFSTKLPGTENALICWVKTDAFRSAIEDLVAGRAPRESLATVDEFLVATGLGFGSAPRDVVRDMLAAFYASVREDLVSSRQGLVLVDNRVGEALRQVHELRADLAAWGFPGVPEGVQRLSAEFFDQVAQKQGWGAGCSLALSFTLTSKFHLPSRR